MNTESIDCHRVEDIQRPGDFKFSDDRDYLYIWLPGTTGPDAIRITRSPSGNSRAWLWDGNLDRPTLTPSIHVKGEWHGYLRAGRLESC